MVNGLKYVVINKSNMDTIISRWKLHDPCCGQYEMQVRLNLDIEKKFLYTRGISMEKGCADAVLHISPDLTGEVVKMDKIIKVLT